MRKKDSAKNFIFYLLSFFVTTALGLIIPRLFLRTYGSEVNGLVSSIKQIFGYFTLLEAGVGGATKQALYGPVAKGEHREVSAVLSATNSFYRRSGLIYAAAVVALSLVYPLVVKTDIERITIVGIILFQGMIGVVRYLVTAKLQLLLNVDGKDYIVSNSGTIFTIVSELARIVLMYAGADILWVQGMFFLVNTCQVIFIVWYTRKHYGWLDLHEKPNFSAISQRKSVLLHEISSLVFSNTDSIILTFFCGLKIVSVYGMYSLIFGMMSSIISVFPSSMLFVMGQLFNLDRKHFEKIQETYETYYLALSFALYSVVYIFILPFLKIYTSGITDVNYIDPWLPVLFLVIQVLSYGRNTSMHIINIAGHFKQTQWHAILEAGINLTVSLVGAHYFGIYGVLFGTVVGLLYRTNDMILYANHKVLNRSARPTYRRWFRNAVILVAVALAGRLLPQSYTGYLPLIGCAAAVTLIVVALFLAVNSLFEKEARRTLWFYVEPVIEKIFRR